MIELIGVFGSGTGYDKELVIQAFKVGEAIASNGFGLISGAADGVGYAASLGAKNKGATTVGVSPASSAHEHVNEFRKPIDSFDIMIFTGMGVDGRTMVLTRSSSAAICVGGEFGTLNEFTSMWLLGNQIIGALESSGLVAAEIRAITNSKTEYSNKLVFGDDPDNLVAKVVSKLRNRITDRELDETAASDVKSLLEG